MRTVAMLGVIAALMAAGLSAAGSSIARAAEMVSGDGIRRHAQSRTMAERCVPWDEAASRAIAQRAQARPDVNVQLVSASIDGMRRARRLCALGSLADACLEYDAVIRGVQRRLQGGVIPPMCRSVAGDVPAT